MNEQTQDANPSVDSSATETQETQNLTDGQVDASSASDTTQAPPSLQQDAKEGAVAEPGLPPKDNLVGEIRRKILDEIQPVIQATVRDAMLGSQSGHSQFAPQQQPQTQEARYQGKYSLQDLEAILRHPEATEYDRAFATRGLAYLDAKQDILKEIDARDEQKVAKSRQEQAIRSIVNDYPQVFNAQANQWNFTDPLFQRTMQFYNSDPRLQSFGNEGLRVAMDRAYAQMAREGQITLKKKETKLNAQQRQIDKNQAQALNSGSLVPAKQQGAEKATKAKLMEAYRKNPDDPDIRTAALKHLIPSSWLT